MKTAELERYASSPASVEKLLLLLGEAARSDVLVLMTRAGFDRGGAGARESRHDVLLAALAAAGGDGLHTTILVGKPWEALRSRGEKGLSEETLRWIEASDLHDRLIRLLLKERPRFSFIFCLDPWAASILAGTASLTQQSRWVSILDSEVPDSATYGPAVRELEGWVGRLPFHERVSLQELRALSTQRSALPAPSPLPARPATPGPWRWRAILPRRSPSVQAPWREFLILIRYANDLLHLKVLLDSLIRQELPKGRVAVEIVTETEAPDLSGYLRIFRIAHPGISVSVSSRNAPNRSRSDDAAIGPAAFTLFADSRHVLPPGFLAGLSRDSLVGPLAFAGVSVPVEAAAHILTGNLDVMAHYGALSQASQGSLGHAGAPCIESALVVLPKSVLESAEGQEVLRCFLEGELPLPSLDRARTIMDAPLLRLPVIP